VLDLFSRFPRTIRIVELISERNPPFSFSAFFGGKLLCFSQQRKRGETEASFARFPLALLLRLAGIRAANEHFAHNAKGNADAIAN